MFSFKYFFVLISLGVLLTNFFFIHRAKAYEAYRTYNGESTYTVGTVWQLDADNVLYSANNTDVASLYRNKDGSYAIRFISPGDTVITAFVRDNDGNLYKYEYLFHIVTKDGHQEDTSQNPADYSQEVLRLVNAERAKANVKPLKLSKDLCNAADIRAKEIERYFSHTRPNGTKFSTLLPSNIQNRAGENIAAGSATPQEVVNQWMNSPGHRQNILDSRYHSLGVGYFKSPDSEYIYYWVQIFLL